MTTTIKTTILITGSTGTFGSHVAKKLQRKVIPFRAAAQSIEKVKNILGQETDAVAFDWNNPSTFDTLFDGISTVYIIAPPFSNIFHQQVIPFLEKAKNGGVKHIVLTTAFGTDANPEGTFFKAEEMVKNLGIGYTILRPNFIFQNFVNFDLQSVRGGAIYVPSGEGKTSYIDVRDIAQVSADVLVNPKEHNEKIYSITGSEALSHNEIAAIFSEVLGKNISNINPTEDEFKNALKSYNVPAFIYDYMAVLYSVIKAGYMSTVTNDVLKVTGKNPILFKSYVEENQLIFLG
ncbi:MAG: SDR family oxidoreductase [Sediminibacterium sp.]|nr:SDR family oxidoreductase [Sediminibacterium sp.]